jgi:hypothetical protein
VTFTAALERSRTSRCPQLGEGGVGVREARTGFAAVAAVSIRLDIRSLDDRPPFRDLGLL